jgi:hypothetical protein
MRPLGSAKRVFSTRYSRLINNSSLRNLFNEPVHGRWHQYAVHERRRIATGVRVAETDDRRLRWPKDQDNVVLNELVEFLKEELPRLFVGGVRVQLRVSVLTGACLPHLYAV